MHLPVAVVVLVALLALVFAACGKSAAEQAKDDACSAVKSIGKQVNQLKSYTLTTVTSDKVKGNVNTIKSDLNKIKSALPKLEASLKTQLQTATDAFSRELSKVASGLGSSISVQAAAGQLTTAANQLETSYKQAFASVSC